MAGPKTQFLSNNNLTRKRWARELFASILPAVEFNYLTGKGPDSPVQIKTDLGKGQGDTITFGVRLQLTGEGIVGNETIEGTEEGMRFRDFNVTIEERGHAVDTGGKMEQQRVPYDLVREGKDGLQEWWAEKLSEHLMNALAGNSGYLIKGAAFGQAISEPDTEHHLFAGGAANEAAITADSVIDLTFLDTMKQEAENMDRHGDTFFKIRPLKKGGKNYYWVILHNFVFDALRQNTNIGQWGDLLRNAQKLQMPQVEIEYNGLMITKSERVPKVLSVGTYGGVYRNMLLGAQAGVWAWGGAGDTKSSVMSFHPYTRDADRFLMIRGNGIYGVTKPRFSSHDYGVLVGSSYGVPLTNQ